MRAPQLLTWSLLGPPVVWAGNEADRGVVLATTSGRTEVHAFDAATSPATLVQVTDRPDGTSGGSVSPDGSTAFWFDDRAGDEVGRWQRVPVSGGEGTTLLSALAPAYPGGIVPLPDGRVAVGRLIDVAPGDNVAFEMAVAGPEGDGTVVYQGSDPAELVAVSHDAALALLGVAPGGNFLRLGVRVVRLADGVVVGELFDDGLSLTAVGFHPSDPRLVLFGHERLDHSTPAVWDLESGEQADAATGLAGDVAAQWYPSGDALLLTVLRDARHTLFRFDRSTGLVTGVATPRGPCTPRRRGPTARCTCWCRAAARRRHWSVVTTGVRPTWCGRR